MLSLPPSFKMLSLSPNSRSDGPHKALEGTQAKVSTLIGKGMLPINVLAAVNAAPSDSSTFGWGGPGG